MTCNIAERLSAKPMASLSCCARSILVAGLEQVMLPSHRGNERSGEGKKARVKERERGTNLVTLVALHFRVPYPQHR